MLVNTLQNKHFEATDAESILDASLKARLFFEYSCNNGQCGVCKTSLLEGEVVELKEQLALSEEDRKAGKILTCCCAPKTDILIDAEDLVALKDIEIKTLPARIQTIKKRSPQIIEIILRLPPNANFHFLEGQYLDVIQNDIRRSYSIASTSCEKEIQLLIKQYPNGQMSNYWFNQAEKNDLLRIEGPKGTFYLRDVTKPLLMMATGTGIAPILSILSQLDRGEDYVQQAPIYLFWGNRFEDDFVVEIDFKKISVNYIKVASKPDVNWQGKVGYIQDIALSLLGDAIVEYEVYACGSNAMIQSAKQSFIATGLSEKQFYSDAFLQSY